MSVDAARLQALREEVNRRHGQLSIIPALRADLHEKQLALIDGPSKRKAGLKGRREGKSTGAASGMLIKGFQSPELTIPFITLSRASAKRIMWGPLHRLNYKHTLGINFNNTDLTATLPNGAAIWLCGANEEDDIEKIRGTDRGYPMAVIDEAASMGRHLRPLVEEVLDAALSDQDGELWMLGSAGVQCKGIFYEATTGKRKEWTSYHSTVLDNPHFPRWAGQPNWRELAKKFLADKRAAKGWAEDHPIYLREWMGQWVASDAGLVYRFSESKNVISDAELEKVQREHSLQYILGVDLGYDDSTAFVVVAFSEDLPVLYEIGSYKQTAMIPSEIAEKIKLLDKEYRFRQMVADTGGLGKSIVEEFKARHNLPIEAAEKTRKQEYIEMANGELHTGRVKVRANSPLVEEWKNLRWDDDGDSLAEDDDDRIVRGVRGGMGKRRREDPRDENHLCFVAGTLIRTDGGERPIESVHAGDFVWTRSGLRRVRSSGQTGIREALVLETTDGHRLIGTGDHPVWTQDGWKPLRILSQNDMLTSWANTGRALGLSTAASRSIGTHNRAKSSSATTSSQRTTFSIARYGAQRTGRFLTAITSTMWTRIRSITNWATSIFARKQNTTDGTGWTRHALDAFVSCVAMGLRPSARPLRCAAQTVAPSTGAIAGWTTLLAPAWSAVQNTAETSTSSPGVALSRVRCVEPAARGAEPVYNLAVDGAHEYFANGVLVSNCDAFLYAWKEALHWMHTPPPPPQPAHGTADYYAAVEARLQEAAFAQVEREKRSGDDILWEDKP